jgi:hypothetical protein
MRLKRRLFFSDNARTINRIWCATAQFQIRCMMHESQDIPMQYWYAVRPARVTHGGWWFFDVREWGMTTEPDVFTVARMVCHNYHLIKRRMK